MRISAKGEYAYRAVYELSRHYLKNPDTVVQLDQIAGQQGIPSKYLVQILLQLKRAGLIGTQRGVRGGYFLRKPPSQITLGEILELIDGPFVRISQAASEPEGVRDNLSHVFNPIFEEARSAIRNILYAITFEEICRRADTPREQMYYI